jgi:methylmalonyl-CoA mutase cobalamin-binding domain/chain
MRRSGSSRHPDDRAQIRFPGEEGAASSLLPSDAGVFNEFGRSILSSLSQTIEGDIIPRLMLAFDSRRTETAPPVGDQERLSAAIDELIQLVLNHDASIATNYVNTLRSDGVPLSALYLDLLAPAARRLGEMWEEDECSFTDVTIGVCRMHQVLLEFSRCFDAVGLETRNPGRDALIIPVPGEQHTFGLFMVMEFMRRGSWNCYSGHPSNAREFHKLVATRDFDVVGISVGASDHVPLAEQLIAELRSGPRNSDAIVMVGGQAFSNDSELAQRIGADACAADGADVVRQAESLVGRADNPDAG